MENEPAVEIEPTVEVEPAVLIEPAVEIELFPCYMAGSNSTAGSINTASSISTAVTLKGVILFLFYFRNSSCFGKKDSHFCLLYGKVILNEIFFNYSTYEGTENVGRSISTATLWKVRLLY